MVELVAIIFSYIERWCRVVGVVARSVCRAVLRIVHLHCYQIGLLAEQCREGGVGVLNLVGQRVGGGGKSLPTIVFVTRFGGGFDFRYRIERPFVVAHGWCYIAHCRVVHFDMHRVAFRHKGYSKCGIFVERHQERHFGVAVGLVAPLFYLVASLRHRHKVVRFAKVVVAAGWAFFGAIGSTVIDIALVAVVVDGNIARIGCKHAHKGGLVFGLYLVFAVRIRSAVAPARPVVAVGGFHRIQDENRTKFVPVRFWCQLAPRVVVRTNVHLVFQRAEVRHKGGVWLFYLDSVFKIHFGRQRLARLIGPVGKFVTSFRLGHHIDGRVVVETARPRHTAFERVGRLCLHLVLIGQEDGGIGYILWLIQRDFARIVVVAVVPLFEVVARLGGGRNPLFRQIFVRAAAYCLAALALVCHDRYFVEVLFEMGVEYSVAVLVECELLCGRETVVRPAVKCVTSVCRGCQFCLRAKIGRCALWRHSAHRVVGWQCRNGVLVGNESGAVTRIVVGRYINLARIVAVAIAPAIECVARLGRYSYGDICVVVVVVRAFIDRTFFGIFRLYGYQICSRFEVGHQCCIACNFEFARVFARVAVVPMVECIAFVWRGRYRNERIVCHRTARGRERAFALVGRSGKCVDNRLEYSGESGIVLGLDYVGAYAVALVPIFPLHKLITFVGRRLHRYRALVLVLLISFRRYRTIISIVCAHTHHVFVFHKEGKECGVLHRFYGIFQTIDCGRHTNAIFVLPMVNFVACGRFGQQIDSAIECVVAH